MGWEERGSGSYYYRKEREGARVKSVYVGTSRLARGLAMLDEMGRLEEEEKREAIRLARAEDAALDQTLDTLGEMARVLTTATLLAEGFHTHKRQWRRAKND
jgi:hypothetical protein